MRTARAMSWSGEGGFQWMHCKRMSVSRAAWNTIEPCPNQGAFAELCQRLQPRLLRTARNCLRNDEDAHDAVQEALLNTYLNLSKFDGRSSFSTWATRIAMNSSLMQLRKRRHSFLPLTDDAPEGLRMGDPAPNPEALLAKKDERRVLKEAIRSLPRNFRAVVELKQFQERSMQELAITCSAAEARFYTCVRPRKFLTRP